MFNSEDVRLLQEAYASVYFDESQYARENPEKYERSPEAREGRRRRSGINDPHTGINSPAFEKFMRQQMGGGKKKKVKEEVFDEILSHLLYEGYADTDQAALAIMANMSEEWKQSIVEFMRGSGPGRPNGGNSTRPGDGKPYADGPLWDSKQKPEDVPSSTKSSPTKKPTPKPTPGNSTRPGDGKPYADGPLFWTTSQTGTLEGLTTLFFMTELFSVTLGGLFFAREFFLFKWFYNIDVVGGPL